MGGPAERAHYRLTFPGRERPRLRVGPTEWPVIECAEHGVRAEAGAVPGFQPGDALEGTLEFKREGSVAVSGTVVRVDASVIVVRLDPPGVPFALLLREQRFLMQHYPGQLTPSTPAARRKSPGT